MVHDRKPMRLAGGTLALLMCGLAGCHMWSQTQNAEGVRQFQQGQYQAAIQRFQQAVATDPANADSYYNLASAYHQLGKLNKRPEDLKQAEDYYNLCLDRSPDHRDCYRALAVLLVEEGRKAEANRLLEGWATRSPSSTAPKVELARLAQESGDRERAREQLLEAVAIDPRDTRALTALGKLQEELGEPERALSTYQRSLAGNTFQPEVAARVAALQGAFSPAPSVTPPGGTRTVATPTVPRR